jgi:hypothetical protein
MTKNVRFKTTRKAESESTPKRLRQPSKPRQPVPESKRTREDAVRATKPVPELVVFDQAIALFNAGRFQAAKEAFAELVAARNRDLAHSAQLRIRICEQRLAPSASTAIPEDH